MQRLARYARGAVELHITPCVVTMPPACDRLCVPSNERLVGTQFAHFPVGGPTPVAERIGEAALPDRYREASRMLYQCESVDGAVTEFGGAAQEAATPRAPVVGGTEAHRMGEPPRDGKKNDVQREDEIRRLQEMVSSLQVGVEELKKKPRKGSRKLKRRPSRGDEAKDDDEAAPTPAAAPAPPERALPAKTKYVSFTARGHGRVETEQSRGAAEEPESIEELTHRSLESIHDSKGREGKKGSFLLHKARKPKLDEKVNAEHAPFPKQPRRRVFPVQDPRTDARFGWDVWLMVLIFYVMLVTPFQISFTRAPDDFVDNFTAGDPPGYNKYIVLAVLNGVVDIMFFADLCLCFNTAFFEDNEWVVSRRRIAVNYVCSWFLLDLLSILPYQLISTRSGFLKMIRMAVCKYIAILLFLLHWTACAIRMIAAVTLDDCHKKRGGLENWRPDSDCAMTVLARFWNRGIWAQYVDALTWALGTLQGDFFTTNLAEQVLCLIVGLVGCIVMAFLIGDLCNVVGNMDPAIVAHQNLGREVARIGFYEQAVRRTFRLYPGTRFAVYPKSKNRQDRPGPLRPCVITHVDDALLFSVRYDDDQSEEHDLVHSRVDVHSYELGFEFERDINRFIYEHDNRARHVKTSDPVARGEKSINPILSFKLFSAKMTIGEDICMLTVGDKKPRRLYTQARRRGARARDAVAGRLATAGEETMRALHHLESVLDHPEHHTTATAVAVASGLEPIISPRRTVGGALEPVGFGCAGDPSADFFAGAICGATSRGS
ncbi:voltage-gated potassium channel [Aureococcus anophagefferens]|nr:voltage-gated potassium channel [Aureococcus anophagefferens]